MKAFHIKFNKFERPPDLLYAGFLLLTFIILLIIAGFLPLLSYQEARRAIIIQETFLSHSLIPQFNGEPYFTKPPLHTWLSFPFFALGKITQQEIFFMRLLSFLSYFGAIYFIYLFSQKNFSKTLLSVLILFSSYRFLSFIYRIDLEPLFVFLTLGTIYFALKYNENSLFKYSFLFYLFFALAFMVRGPLHFFLIPAFLLYALFSKNKNFLKLLFNPAGWFIFLSIVLPFYVFGYLKYGSKIFHEFLKTDLSNRLFEKKDPFYYYFKAFILNFIPYFFLLFLKIKTLKECFSYFLKKYPSNFFISLCIFPLIFLSFTGQKFDKYLLFLYPFFSLFLAELLLKLYRENFLFKLSSLFYGLSFLAVILTLLIPYKNLKIETNLWKIYLDPTKEYLFYQNIQPLALFLLKRPVPLIENLENLQDKNKILISSEFIKETEFIKEKNLLFKLKDPYKKETYWFFYQIE